MSYFSGAFEKKIAFVITLCYFKKTFQNISFSKEQDISSLFGSAIQGLSCLC